MTSATGAATHYMQKASNVPLGNSNAKYATSLATSQQCGTKKVKGNTHLIHFNQANQKHNNFMRGLYTPYMMPIAVHQNQRLKTLSVYR